MINYSTDSGERNKNKKHKKCNQLRRSSVSATAPSSVKPYVDIQNDSEIFDEQKIDM